MQHCAHVPQFTAIYLPLSCMVCKNRLERDLLSFPFCKYVSSGRVFFTVSTGRNYSQNARGYLTQFRIDTLLQNPSRSQLFPTDAMLCIESWEVKVLEQCLTLHAMYIEVTLIEIWWGWRVSLVLTPTREQEKLIKNSLKSAPDEHIVWHNNDVAIVLDCGYIFLVHSWRKLDA